MTANEIVARRLVQQRLVGPLLEGPEAVVRWFGAVQAQDYHGAKWALGQRCGADDAGVEAAFNAGRILRTHLCRPTWHFTAPEDIRWLLMLTGPRVQRVAGTMYRKLGLEERTLRRADETLARALQGGRHLDRFALADALKRARIDTGGMRLVHLLFHAELEGVICSGPRQGKQFTYALLEERVPKAPMPHREEALAELVRRYFTSRGPASLNDFALWSGLTIADGRKGIALQDGRFQEVTINGRPGWYLPSASVPKVPANTAHLVPNYDEYGIGYKDRSAFYDPKEGHAAQQAGVNPFRHLVLLNGRMCGTWERMLTKDTAEVRLALFTPLSAAARKAVGAAAKRYARFLGLRAVA